MNVNKVIESSRNWKLANDVELLKRLEKFSENIICNATKSLKSMDNLEDSLNETFLRVRTVANKFQAIADNQFIENRVQEEEEFVLANEKRKDSEGIQVSPEASKAQLLESIRECQTALSKKFETVQLSGIDSEDEMAHSSPVVLVPKNVYKERRLPHLIGGQQFITDETLGLMSNARNADDSVESDEDMDETDRSSLYSSSLKKSASDQIETVIPSLIESAKQERVLRGGSPIGNFSSNVSLEGKPKPPIEEDILRSAMSNIPAQRGVLSESASSLLEENKGHFVQGSAPTLRSSPTESRSSLFEEKKRLFGEESLSSRSSFHQGNLFEANRGLFAEDSYSCFEERNLPEKNCDSPPQEPPKTESASSGLNRSASRDKLLAGHNFASFKEDLARVLSNAGPYRKPIHSSGAKANPMNTKSSEDGEDEDDVLSPLSANSLSTPESSSVASVGLTKPSESQITPENFGSVTLPDVSTNTLENLAKGRPKLKGNRRPPSRKHRQGSSFDADGSNANLSPSFHSDDASIQESASTQPGSNILSPATDEEDLFVLPAFDLPTDPPSRSLLFNNTLLSPGATIDDEGSLSSPLLPPSSTVQNAQVETPEKTPPVMIQSSQQRESIQPTKHQPKSEVPRLAHTLESSEKNIFGPLSDSPPDLFSTEPLLASRKITPRAKTESSSATDLFPPSISSSKNILPTEDDDIFSSVIQSTPSISSPLKKQDPSLEPNLFPSSKMTAKLSPSPKLFNDPSDDEVQAEKKAKSSLMSGLPWDLLGSDDFGEDLFRSSKSSNRPKPQDEPELREPALVHTTEKKTNNLFSPTEFEKSKDGMFFDDDAFSSTDLFSDSSSFMRLSLPSNTKDSLFASDDDDDDDSLFKSSKKSGPSSSPKIPGKTDTKSSKQPPSETASHNVMNDPLMCMDDAE